eukprot:s120_g44.t1
MVLPSPVWADLRPGAGIISEPPRAPCFSAPPTPGIQPRIMPVGPLWAPLTPMVTNVPKVPLQPWSARAEPTMQMLPPMPCTRQEPMVQNPAPWSHGKVKLPEDLLSRIEGVVTDMEKNVAEEQRSKHLRCPALEGDQWCLGCSGWEALGRELSGNWDLSGCRVLANDLVINTCRQVRALRSLGAGLAQQENAERAGLGRGSSSVPPRADVSRAPVRERSEIPRRIPRSPPGPPPQRPKVERAPQAEESDDEEEEEEEPEEDAVHEGGDTNRRPPGPDPPRREGHSSRRRERSRSAGRSRADKSHRERRDRHHQSSRPRRGKNRGGKTRRAGRKHQRLRRLATNPHLVVHRKASGRLLELSSVVRGSEALHKGD